jgi:glycine betaine/proline transport system substrate-binding protein
MSEAELGSLEAEINRRGQGHEDDAVAAWLAQHPGMADRMTPR